MVWTSVKLTQYYLCIAQHSLHIHSFNYNWLKNVALNFALALGQLDLSVCGPYSENFGYLE